MPITIKRTIRYVFNNSLNGNKIGGKDEAEKEAKRKVQNYTVKMRTTVRNSKRG